MGQSCDREDIRIAFSLKFVTLHKKIIAVVYANFSEMEERKDKKTAQELTFVW